MTTENPDIEALLADPQAVGEVIKTALARPRKTVLDEVLIGVVRGYLKARSAPLHERMAKAA